MPYLGRTRPDPWNWCTLPEAIEYVTQLDRVEPLVARRQIHEALIDGAIAPAWENPRLASPPCGSPWENADIDWVAGTVFDNFDPSVTAERRVLLIYKPQLASVFGPKANSKVPLPIVPLSGNRAPAIIVPESETTPRTPPSRLKPFWPDAERAIMEELRDNGCPAPGDGGQAELERFVANWLHQHGHDEASTPTIRRHVRKCMDEYRKETGSLD